MAQSSEIKLLKRFDQDVEITGNLTLGGNAIGINTDNFYLDGITKSGNTLTFSVNGATNQSYTFGSNAFTSYTDHSTQGYLTSLPSHNHNFLQALDDYVWNASTNGRNFPLGIQTSFVSSGQSYPSFGSVVRIATYTGINDGGTAELYFPYSATYGGSSMRYRLGMYNNAGWTGWKTVIDSDSIGSQSVNYATSAGSAGDAGTIDGIDSSRIIYGNNTSGTNEGNYSDWDALSKTGFYSHSGAAGRWSSAANWSSVLHFRLYDDNNNYASQLGFNTYDNRIYARTRNAGTWTAWDEIITTGNKDSYTYPPASHDHDGVYVKEGGTSFSGEYPVVVRTSADVIYSDENIKFRGSDSRLTVDGSIETPRVKVTGSHNGNFGYASFSWGGSSGYPTLFSDHSDRWVMHVKPHIVWTQNGQRGYTGNTEGSMIRFEGNLGSTVSWDAGCLTDIASGGDYWGVTREGTWSFYSDPSANFYANSSMRAPAFYDRNNTAYFTDPASTSYLNGLQIQSGNVWMHNSRTLSLSGDPDTFYPVVFPHDARHNVIQIRKHVHNYQTWDGRLAAEIHSWSSTWGGDQGYAYLAKNRYNNRQYIAKVAQSAGPNNYVVVWLRGARSYSVYTSPVDRVGTPYYSTTDLGGSNGSVSPTTTVNFSNVYWATNSNGEWNSNTKIVSHDSMQSPILYDNNNTSYYINPDGLSYINEIRSNEAQANPRYDTAFYVLQAQHWYGDTSSQGMYLGESGNDVYIRGQVAIGGTAIQSGYALTMSGHVDMNANDINYVNQLHFNDNVRFYDDGNDSNLNFKYGDANGGAIVFWNGGGTRKGYIYADNSGFGLLDNDGNWAVRTQLGTSPLELRCDNNVEFEVYNSFTLSRGSSRAPIYYDSDDTSWYVNPNDVSNLWNLRAYRMGITNSSSTTRYGISLYGGEASGEPTYGLLFTGTSLGTHGSVTGSWATYFTMNNDNTRGWIFRRVGSGNCASISGGGTASFNGDVIAYYSDMRLKTKLGDIEDPIGKIQALNGFYYEPNEVAESYGYEKETRVGLSAQEVEAVLPEIVTDAPIGDGYKTVDYAKLVPVLVEAIKEQQKQIDELKSLINKS